MRPGSSRPWDVQQPSLHSTALLNRRAASAAALLWFLCAPQGAAQTFLGDYTGHSVAGRSVTITAGAASVRLTPYAPDILRVDFLPTPASAPDSSFSVIRDTSGAGLVAVLETDSVLHVTAGLIGIRCSKYPLRLAWLDQVGGTILEEPQTGGLASEGGSRSARFATRPGMHFYGTGERGIGPDLRGRSFASSNTQVYGYGAALSTMNINVPFLATSAGFGLFFDNTWPGWFDLGAADPAKFLYSAGGGELTFYVIAAGSVPAQLERYTWLTGRQPLPPRWAFGYLQSKYGYRNEAEARALVATMRQKRIPCDAVILDLYWYDRMGDLAWSPVNFPDPAGMVTDLLAAGVKTVLITQPYLTVTSAHWAEASAARHLATNALGQSYMLPNWWSCNCPASLLDVTRASTRAWWWEKHPPFMGSGVAGLWTDLGEPERHPADMVHHLGSSAKVHNIFNLLWAKAVFEGYSQFRPDHRLFNLTRSGFAGIQRYGAITWSGDVARTFGGLGVQIPMLLNMGMSGLPYQNSDIGGFCCGTTTPELYIRWLQFGTFSPVMRAHGAGPAVGGQDTEPWSHGPEAERVATEYIRLRYRLLPYIYSMAHENYGTGMPIARPLFFDDPEGGFDGEGASYLFGKAFLVSPVFSPGQTARSVGLPRGLWYDFWTDRQERGGVTVTVPAPLETIPLFVRAGSIIPMQPVREWTGQSPPDTLFLAVYPSPSGPSSFELVEDDGESLGYARGEAGRTLLEQSLAPAGARASLSITIGRTEGSYPGKPTRRVYLSEVHGIALAPVSVTRDGLPVPRRSTLDELRRNGDGWFHDPASALLSIHTPTFPDSSCRILADGLTPVSVHAGDDLPGGYALEQNFPNPFNAETVIRYRLPQAVRVRLAVYDLLGREVAVLAEGVEGPGRREVRWDAGARASGLYLCRLEAGGFAGAIKLLLVR